VALLSPSQAANLPAMLAHMASRESTTNHEEASVVSVEPTPSSALAAISLLTDNDPTVVDTCRRQLLEWGSTVRPLLDRTVRSRDQHLASCAGEILRSVDLADWLQRIRDFAVGLSHEGRLEWQVLERGVLLISSLDRPEPIDEGQLRSVLDHYADDLRPRVAGKSPVTAARILTGYLGTRLGYVGSQSSFYDVANIHFDQVVSLRRGIPVSLTVLYMLVARRAGLDVTGVAIPDHFLLRVNGPCPVLVDPYHEGRQVTKADCLRYLRHAGYSLHTTSYLEDMPDRQIFDCLLRNLLRVYGYQEDTELCTVLESARQVMMRD
jgi:regulator of sirC expression with transglutaminase-like and TPR domain